MIEFRNLKQKNENAAEPIEIDEDGAWLDPLHQKIVEMTDEEFEAELAKDF